MAIYDKASLVLIPSGTKTSKVYSQKPTSGDGDFTFSRSTAATRVNADGVIEKETQNLVPHSNTFSSWHNQGNDYTLTSGQSGYDGSSDAWLLAKGSTQNKYLLKDGLTDVGVFTASLYAKAGTADGVMIYTENGYVRFDLTDGTKINGGSAIDDNIEDVGNGWYRCSVTGTGTRVFYIKVVNDTGVETIGNIYIQDAQLEQGLVARDYIETTTTAVEGGITDNVPRLDYTDSSCPSLLLEPQRTNDWKYSEPTSGAIGSINNAGDFSDINSFSSIGLYGGAILQGGATQYIYDGPSVADSTTYTLTCYMKTSDGAAPVLANSSGSASGDFVFIIGGASKTALDPSINYSITQFSGDIYKVVATMTSAASVTNRPNNGIIKFNTNRNADLEITGFQWELGSYATSLIPTYGSAVTRNAENTNTPTSSGVADLIGQTEGTAFIDVEYLDGALDDIFILHRSAADGIGVSKNNSSFLVRVYQNGTLTNTAGGTTADSFKLAVTYNSNGVKMFINGALNVSNEFAISFNSLLDNIYLSANPFYISRQKKNIKQFMVFPTALTDQEAIDLTTI